MRNERERIRRRDGAPPAERRPGDTHRRQQHLPALGGHSGERGASAHVADPDGGRAIIAGHAAVLTSVVLPRGPMSLWAVADLEQIIDRGAVLRGAVEPPYWAYLWSGARALAEYVDRWVAVRGRRVLDVGCGLGLCGLAAARGGAEVTCVDVSAPAIAFVEASARANGVACTARCRDATALPQSWRFDLVLAAEVVYEREGFGALAAALVDHLRPGGTVLVADAYRTDTRRFYAELAARGATMHALDLRVLEEGRAVPLRLASLTRRS